MTDSIEIRCAFCQAAFKRTKIREEKHPLKFCAYCGARIQKKIATSLIDPSSLILKEHVPDPDEVLGSIGNFLLLQSIGKGGMGEVFLAFDTICGRRVALKRIRPDLMSSQLIKERFIREARITSQLNHPSIIPIYTIYSEDDLIYYTMPLLGGHTLKQMLRKAREESFDAKTSIATFVRLFLNVLHAIAYAHSKGVLHRDLKPENIIVGTYGEVVILDWGLIKLVEEDENDENDEISSTKSLTRMEKPVGTVNYMAPERAQGQPSSKQTDIYALGVIFYQTLTLKMPFLRKDMKTFLKAWQNEEFIPPEIRAPYRDLPKALSEIVKKALSPNPKDRYETCDEMIDHIESFLEGRSEWFHEQSLNLNRKTDWEFQEHILLAEHTAITRSSEMAKWYGLMLSKNAFSENIRLEIALTLGKTCRGIGFILGAPTSIQRHHLMDGYCLWFTSQKEKNQPTTLSRSTIVIHEVPDLSLSADVTYTILIEKIDQTITLYINNVRQFVYVSHFPVVGTRVGIITQDLDFTINSFDVSVGSQSIMVNCLAVPDAFLANSDYAKALAEYQRIGNSFLGRAEGREALFRAGITLLEQGKSFPDSTKQETFFEKARIEFEKLRHTPGAPLEYLGKAHVYQTTEEFEEEAKCFELAFRRYKHHPLLRVLVEHVGLRMHETSRQHRVAAYYFISLVARFLPEIAKKPSSQDLFESLYRNWEIPPFLFSTCKEETGDLHILQFCLGLSFWLEQTYIIKEIFDSLIEMPELPICHIIDCLVLFSYFDNNTLLIESLARWKKLLCSEEQEKYNHIFKSLELLLIEDKEQLIEASCNILSKPENIHAHVLLMLMEQSLRQKDYAICLALYEIKGATIWSEQLNERILSLAIEAALWLNDADRARCLLEESSSQQWTTETSPLFYAYGCLLAAEGKEEEALKHFSQVLDAPYPRTWLLGAHVLSGKLIIRTKGWLARSFLYEQHMLIRQLTLYAHITKKTDLPGMHLLP